MRLIDETSGTQKIVMVEMNRAEALKTIKSLAEQLYTKNANTGRYEEITDCGTDFSIAVNSKKGADFSIAVNSKKG